jgi:hypothetical protein
LFDKLIKKAAVLGISAAMLVSAAVPALAATHDATEDASTDTATVTLGKILTSAQENKFPNVNTFNFTVTKVQAWKNANVDTAQSGETIPVADMPSWSNMSPTIGNFNTAASGDTSTVRTRTGDITAQFTQAGYYVYKVVETGSTPANVTGVSYDDHEYFIVVYVCNKTDANGNTIDGVYVHDITSYRNTSGSSTYSPNLSDIANVTDNGNTAASANTRDNLAKVGKSTPEDPDALEAYRFWNDYASQNVEISKNVTGSLGDLTKEFEFTVTLTGLDAETAYQLSNTVSVKGTPSVGTYDATAKTITTDASGNATFVVKLKDGEKLVIEGLGVGSHYTVNEAASDHKASYEITSSNTNMVTRYVEVAVEDADSEKTYYLDNDGTDTVYDPSDEPVAPGTIIYEKVEEPEAVIAQESDANTANNTALATAQETVDATDGTITVAYTNDRNLTPPTGVALVMIPLAIAGIALGLALALKRKHETTVEDIE